MPCRSAKSDRLTAGGWWLEVSWTPKGEPAIVPGVGAGFGIVYDDDDIVVIDKPPGVAAHPSVGWDGPTVLGALAGAGFRIATSGSAERAGIVHRLDVGTSGLMVVAKTEPASARSSPPSTTGRSTRSTTPSCRAIRTRYQVLSTRRRAAPGALGLEVRGHRGRQADGVTHYDTIEAMRSATLLEVHLETGRTHQIRVHMAAQRQPCVGDPLYGADPRISPRLGLTRQWLHAHELSFAHPSSGDQVTFTSPISRRSGARAERWRSRGLRSRCAPASRGCRMPVAQCPHGDRGATRDGVRRREDHGRAQAARRERVLVPELSHAVEGESRALGHGPRRAREGALPRGTATRCHRLRRRRGRRVGRRAPPRRHGLRHQPQDPAHRRPRRLVGVVHPGTARSPGAGHLAQVARGRRRVRADNGAPAIEGYPVDNKGEKVDLTMAYVGTRSLFQKAGFRKAADTTRC